LYGIKLSELPTRIMEEPTIYPPKAIPGKLDADHIGSRGNQKTFPKDADALWPSTEAKTPVLLAILAFEFFVLFSDSGFHSLLVSESNERGNEIDFR